MATKQSSPYDTVEVSPEQLAEINKQIYASPEAIAEIESHAVVEEGTHAEELAQIEEEAYIPVIDLDMRKLSIPTYLKIERHYYDKLIPGTLGLKRGMEAIEDDTFTSFKKTPTEIAYDLVKFVFEVDPTGKPPIETLTLEDVEYIAELVTNYMRDKKARKAGGITKK